MPRRVCPSGHELPVEQFKSYIDLTKEGDESINFECPGGKRGHTFSLSKAVASRMFTEEEATKIREMAARTKQEAEVE